MRATSLSSAPLARGRRSVHCLAALWAAGVLAACHGERDAASEARETQRREARELAEQAGRLAAGDTSRGAAKDSLRISLGSESRADFTHGDDPPLGAGDVRVTSTDGMLVLALIGDTVRSRLGDSAVVRMRREMAAGTDTVSGFGGVVARTVVGAVSGAMKAVPRFAMRMPVGDVRDLRYDDGQLHYRTGKDGQISARFAPGDAERFMAAVRARQARPAGR